MICAAARRARLPHFAYEYGDGGAGDDTGIKHNWAALDAIEMVPRYGVMPKLPPVDVELFGRKYSAPLGVAPMGSPIVVWPGADKLLAKAAQRARVPYTLGVAGGATIEEIAEIAPDVMWLQLYRFAKNDHAIGFDLMRRADAAGVHVLMLTLDVPVRTVRSREVKVGHGRRRRIQAGLAHGRRHGEMPRLGRRVPAEHACRALPTSSPMPARTRASTTPSASPARRWAARSPGTRSSATATAGSGPLIVKGILHPEDAEKAVSLGIDGILVSNHGGRQIEALPAPIDCVPAVVKAVGSRATVLFDSGVRSGTDVARALALGANAALAGKAFLWGLGALGAEGPGHVIDLMIDELQSALGQIGAHEPGRGAERQSPASRARCSSDLRPRAWSCVRGAR